MTRKKILIVEDEKQLGRILGLVLQDNGYDVKTASDGGQGMAVWTQWGPDAVLTDLNMKPVDGMAVLKFGRLNFPQTPLIMLTAFGTIETAVMAMKNGAFDFLAKPVDHGQLVEVVAQALASGSAEEACLDALIGSSSSMEKIRQDIILFAATDSSVLIRGESGTGKELASRALYGVSNRKAGPFVKVNCAAIPKELIESELFGHKKGAFTGALRDRKGAFVQADGGVLFLDEVGDLPLELQAKLLHAVEEKTITPVGSEREIPVSVKILSATNRDLEKMIATSEFRPDLYFRLNTVCLTMPALRERRSDIRELAFSFVEKFCREFARPLFSIARETMDRLETYAWPGNVRELKNVIEQVAITCPDDLLMPRHLPRHLIFPGREVSSLASDARDYDIASQEQRLMLSALEECGWNQSRAAKKLGITRGALRYRLQKYGIQRT